MFASINTWTPFSKVVAALFVTFVIGAFGGGWVFELFHPIPPAASVGVRGSLGLAVCCFIIFAVSVIRILRGEEPLDLKPPADANPLLATIIAIIFGYLIGTSIFR
jgi:hypothetical protein